MKRFWENLVGVLFIFIALFMFMQVLARYVFHHSFSYSEEVVRYLFIWATLIGTAVAFRQGEHISVSLLPSRIKDRFSTPLRWIFKTATSLFLIILAWHGIQCAKMQWVTKQTSAALGWPIIWVTLSIPVGALLSLWMILTLKTNHSDEKSPPVL